MLDKCLVDGKKGENYAPPLDGDWALEATIEDDKALCLDVTHMENIAQFLNHRCEDANLLDMQVLRLKLTTCTTTMYNLTLTF